MMKFVLAALAVLAVSTPTNAYQLPRTGSGALADTLQDFVDVIPTSKILNLVIRYMAEDREFGELVNYARSKEFRALVQDTQSLPEVVSLFNYIQKAGLDMYYLANKFNQFIGIPGLTPPKSYQLYKISGGIRGFLDDVEALIPVSKIKAIYYEKMNNSKVFIDFMERARGPDSQTIANAIAANPNLKHLLDMAKKAGIDSMAIIKFLEKFLGINIPIEV